MNSRDFKALKKVKPNRWVHKIWLITFAIVGVLFGMLFLPWQQTVRGEGVLIAQDPTQRDYQIASTVDGFIQKLYVRENQKVKKGDKLFQMVDLDQNYSARIENIDKRIDNQILYTNEEISTLSANRDTTVQQLETGKSIYEKRLHQAMDELKSLEFKKSAMEQNYRTEQANFERIKALYHESIESKRSLERAENTYAKAKAEWEKVNVDLDIQKRNVAIISQEKEQFLLDMSNKIRMVDNGINSARVRINALERDDERQQSDIARYSTSDVRAEKDGHVLRVLVNDQNKYLPKGEPVIHFAPAITTRTVIFKISDFHMPLIKKGLPVRIKFYGWPALQVSGWPKIQFGTFSGIVDRVDPIAFDQGFYYAYVVEDPKEPWPKEDILRVGTRATLWARLSTVPIWYQLWRTMNAVPPKMLTPEKEL